MGRRDGLRTPMDYGTPQNTLNNNREQDKFDLGQTSPTMHLGDNSNERIPLPDNPEISRPSQLTPAREKLSKKPKLVINTEVNVERDGQKSPQSQQQKQDSADVFDDRSLLNSNSS